MLRTLPRPSFGAEQKQAAEQERQRGEVLARQLASAREDVGTLTARVTALTDARTEAEKALQTAQASAAEQKLALEQERERGDALVRELASAREEVEARKAAANAAAAEQKQAAEQERQRGEVLARQLASAREDVGTLTARVTALTDARTEAEKALQTAQASAAEQKLALEQERERGDALVRELASAREEVEVRKAAANAADASPENTLTSSSVRVVSTGGSNDTGPDASSPPPASKSPLLPTTQGFFSFSPRISQPPELAPPASMRAGRGDHQANGAGQSLHDLARQNPPQRIDNRNRLVHGVRPLGRGYRLPRRQGVDRTELLDRFPDQIRSRVRHFGNRVHGNGIGARNYSSISMVWPLIGSQKVACGLRRVNTRVQGRALSFH